MRSGIFAVVLFLVSLAPFQRASGQLLEKQWQSLGAFPSGVECVYFLDLPGPPRIGFLGSGGTLFRTSNGGASWVPVLTNANIFPSDFTFENADTGWFANFLPVGSPVYETTDGGLTWAALAAPAPYPTSIYYNRSDGLLLLSSWEEPPQPGTVSISSDGGSNWSIVAKNAPFNGFAFMNGDSGVVTEKENGLLRTTDGGHSWIGAASFPSETWQPDPDTIRRLIWAASERGPNASGVGLRPPGTAVLFKSTDFGNTVPVVGVIPSITGTMCEGSCGALYLQAESYDSIRLQSMLQSSDGISWTPLFDSKGQPGPINVEDTRFYVKGDYIFAGGTVPGDDSIRLWRYVADSTRFGDEPFTIPKISTNNFHIVSTSCLGLDSALYLIYYNDCIPAILVSAQLADTSRFALLLRDTLPHEASGFYPITVEHLPNGRSSDTTELYIHAYADGQDIFDTVLVTADVLGAQIAAPFDIVANGVKNAWVAGGDTTVFTIRLTDSLPASLGLDSIAFTTNFNGNVLSFDSVAAILPWSLIRESHSGGTEMLTLAPPTGMTAEPDTAIARIFYTADVAPNASTNYIISDIRLNDASFEACAGAASLPQPPTVTVVGCGDTVLRNTMAGRPIIQLLGIERVNGNPEIAIQCTEVAPLDVELYNEIGEPVQNTPFTALGGKQTIPIPTSCLASGLYIIALRTGSLYLGSEPFVLSR